MKITVNKQAADWFKDNVGLTDDRGIRFKNKIYGGSPVNETFALVFEPNHPEEPAAEYRSENGILFFVEEGDLWFFNGHDLEVAYDEDLDEPKYIYLKDGQAIN